MRLRLGGLIVRQACRQTERSDTALVTRSRDTHPKSNEQRTGLPTATRNGRYECRLNEPGPKNRNAERTPKTGAHEMTQNRRMKVLYRCMYVCTSVDPLLPAAFSKLSDSCCLIVCSLCRFTFVYAFSSLSLCFIVYVCVCFFVFFVIFCSYLFVSFFGARRTHVLYVCRSTDRE